MERHRPRRRRRNRRRFRHRLPRRQVRHPASSRGHPRNVRRVLGQHSHYGKAQHFIARRGDRLYAAGKFGNESDLFATVVLRADCVCLAFTDGAIFVKRIRIGDPRDRRQPQDDPRARGRAGVLCVLRAGIVQRTRRPRRRVVRAVRRIRRCHFRSRNHRRRTRGGHPGGDAVSQPQHLGHRVVVRGGFGVVSLGGGAGVEFRRVRLARVGLEPGDGGARRPGARRAKVARDGVGTQRGFVKQSGRGLPTRRRQPRNNVSEAGR